MIALLLALALAQEAPQAEHYRLQSEMAKLAQKSSWSGVTRTYRAMIALQIPLHPSDHLLGAQAAIADGDALLALVRLQRVTQAPAPTDEQGQTALAQATSTLEHLQSRFGPVSIAIGPEREAALIRLDAPFAPDERAAVERARQLLAQDRRFRGLLPVGDYGVAGVDFTVEAGRDWQDVVASGPR